MQPISFSDYYSFIFSCDRTNSNFNQNVEYLKIVESGLNKSDAISLLCQIALFNFAEEQMN
jgi:hypothetical protein